MCREPSTPAFSPFCSRLCEKRDLLNWMDGRYAVPAVEAPDDDEIPDIGEDDPPMTKN